ncbi:MAG: hypothetical protein HQ462_03530 [Deltaproteobacteria bacterium]|nr:hypothetical protein [Deltaproteobacteria bacterium]
MISFDELRLYHRFKINNDRLCFISQSGTNVGIVTELSYGGFSLAPIPTQPQLLRQLANASENGAIQTIEFHFLNRSVRCQIEKRYSENEKLGYQFTHEHTQVLSFLKDIIPWIRAGAAIIYLEKLESEGFENELPDYLSFEGPIPVEVDWNGLDSQGLANFNLSFRQDKVTFQLSRKNNQLLTLHNVWPGGTSGDLRPTQGIDSMILRNSLAILLGLSTQEVGSVYPKLIEVVLNLFEKAQAQTTLFLQKKTG